MSHHHVERLRLVRDEYDTAREAIQHLLEIWPSVATDLAPRKRYDLETVVAHLEVTYFVRLAAEFEAVLCEHLLAEHPAIRFPASKADWKVDWFVSKIWSAERLPKNANLRRDLVAVRDHRNSLAHGQTAPNALPFAKALSIYNRFLIQLAEPSR